MTPLLSLADAEHIKRRRDRTPPILFLRAAIGRSRTARKPLCLPLSQLWHSGKSMAL
jgi:hypothetical protein